MSSEMGDKIRGKGLENETHRRETLQIDAMEDDLRVAKSRWAVSITVYTCALFIVTAISEVPVMRIQE